MVIKYYTTFDAIFILNKLDVINVLQPIYLILQVEYFVNLDLDLTK